jgi:hypothetical protein
MAPIRSQRTLLSVTAILLTLLLTPNLIAGVQDDWTEQIAHHLREEKTQAYQEAFGPAYDRYLAQLQVVQQALLLHNPPAVKKELNRLIQMIAVREGGISQSSSLSLIFYISEVTPSAYHDETMKSHFRLVRQLFTSGVEASREPPSDASYGSAAPPRIAPWGLNQYSWMGKIRFHPMFILGLGVLILVAVGGVVLLFVGLRGASSENKPSVQSKSKHMRLR